MNPKSKQPEIEYTEKYILKTPSKKVYFMVSETDLDRIRKMVSNLKGTDWYSNLGSIFIGFAGSSFLTYLITDNSFPYRQNVLFFAILTVVVGALFYLISFLLSQTANFTKEQILNELDVIKNSKSS